MSYSDKLKDPRWQKLRFVILTRDGWKCLSCGDGTINLQVHHIVYRRHHEPWDYPEYLYQTLCEKCHKERQELTDKAVDALRIALAKVPTQRLTIRAQQICDAAMEELESK